MRLRLAACLAAFVAFSGACGGRLIKSETDGAGTGSGDTASFGGTPSTGATGSDGGRPSRGGTLSIGGAPAGGSVGIAGTSSSAGSPSSGGAACGCPPVACPPGPGFQTVLNPDGCCYHCECNPMLCPAIACGSGSRLGTQPGQCCPTCIQDDCAKGQAGYQDFKKQLVEKYSSLGCMTSGDCTVYYEKNQCAVGCGIAMPSAAAGSLDSNLQNYAQQACGPGCAMPIPPCPAPKAPICDKGLCR